MTDTQVMAALEPTQVDKEWADKVIAVEHPNNHGAYEYAVAQVIAAHRLVHSPAAEPVAFAYERNGKVRVNWGERSPEMIPAWKEISLYAAPVPPPAGDETLQRAQQIVAIANRYEGADPMFDAVLPVGVLRAAAMIINGKAFEPLVDKMRITAGDAELRKALDDESEERFALIIKAQMREQWDEICADTGCHPLDFERRGKEFWYSERHWSEAVAQYAAQDIVASLYRAGPALATPPSVPAQREGINCEEIAITHGQQVSVTFKDKRDALALFDELNARSIRPATPPSQDQKGVPNE